MPVRIHRNLNDRTSDRSAGWVITENGKTRRVADLVASIITVKVSEATLQRIRTPKGEKTPRGAQGLGKRTVGAWLVGSLLEDYKGTPTGSTIHFNPFIDDDFKIQTGGEFSTFTGGAVLHFKRCGGVDVIG